MAGDKLDLSKKLSIYRNATNRTNLRSNFLTTARSSSGVYSWYDCIVDTLALRCPRSRYPTSSSTPSSSSSALVFSHILRATLQFEAFACLANVEVRVTRVRIRSQSRWRSSWSFGMVHRPAFRLMSCEGHCVVLLSMPWCGRRQFLGLTIIELNHEALRD